MCLYVYFYLSDSSRDRKRQHIREGQWLIFIYHQGTDSLFKFLSCVSKIKRDTPHSSHSQKKKKGGAFGRVFFISMKDMKEVELQWGKEANEWNSGKACALSLCLAACVININSTKWAVIKLSRVVNDPQRQNWNVKGAQARMHRRRRAARRTFSQFVRAPTQHSNTHMRLISDKLSNQKYCCRQVVDSTKYAFLKQNTFFFFFFFSRKQKKIFGSHTPERTCIF